MCYEFVLIVDSLTIARDLLQRAFCLLQACCDHPDRIVGIHKDGLTLNIANGSSGPEMRSKSGNRRRPLEKPHIRSALKVPVEDIEADSDRLPAKGKRTLVANFRPGTGLKQGEASFLQVSVDGALSVVRRHAERLSPRNEGATTGLAT